MESTSIETAAAAAKPHHKNSPSPRSSVETIAAWPGVIAVLVDGDEYHVAGDDKWTMELSDLGMLSKRGDFAGRVGDHVGLRALTRGGLSIAVAFKNDSPISKSLVRAMRKCLANIEAARTVTR